MISKTFEIRDRGTFIPVLAIKLKPEGEEDRFLLARSGFGTVSSVQEEYVIVYKLCTDEAHYDPYSWDFRNGRTMRVAHEHIRDNFDKLKTGDVIDVEFLLGETEFPKTSESLLEYQENDRPF